MASSKDFKPVQKDTTATSRLPPPSLKQAIDAAYRHHVGIPSMEAGMRSTTLPDLPPPGGYYHYDPDADSGGVDVPSYFQAGISLGAASRGWTPLGKVLAEATEEHTKRNGLATIFDDPEPVAQPSVVLQDFLQDASVSASRWSGPAFIAKQNRVITDNNISPTCAPTGPTLDADGPV